jgi:hypothetical protein
VREIQSLKLNERIALFFILFVLGTCTMITFALRSQKNIDTHESISIYLAGEVFEEKSIQVPYGATIADVIAFAKFTELADLDKMAHDALVSQNQVVIVPRKGYTSIFVKGAVNKNKVLIFKEGATFFDLQQKVQLHKDADIRALLRKKRALKDGETIEIKFKK